MLSPVTDAVRGLEKNIMCNPYSEASRLTLVKQLEAGIRPYIIKGLIVW